MKAGKRLVNTSLSVFHLLFIMSFACAPMGELKRSIHPPHKRYLDRLTLATAASVNSALRDDSPQLAKGLPDSCKIEKADSLRLRCESEHWLVERSYSFKGDIDPSVDCQHNNEIIKCLKKIPPFALYLDWHSSHEKFLRENFLTWKETVHQIWDEKLTSEERIESSSIMASLDWLTIKLSSQTSIEESDSDQFLKMLNLGAGQEKKGREFLASMQSARLSGKLSLKLLLDRMDEFYDQTHGPSPLWEELRTMSLDGLDD